MATTRWTNTVVSSDATFRTNISAWDVAIQAMGLVQTADTGQINFSTVTRPGTTFTKAGYAIYRFDDALQGSYPFYIRVDYGTGDTITRPGFWYTIGTGTDGAGTLTNPSTTVFVQNTGNSSYSNIVSGNTSRLTFGMQYNLTSSPVYTAALSIERIQTTAGANANTGASITVFKNVGSGGNANTYFVNHVVYSSGTQPSANLPASAAHTSLQPNLGGANRSWCDGNKVYIAPIYPIGRTVHPPLQGLALYHTADIPYQNPGVVVEHYGSNATFIPLDAGAVGSILITNMSVLVRCE